jgi:DCN1-like protein 1/2
MGSSSRPSQQQNSPPTKVCTDEPGATINERGTSSEDSGASIDRVASTTGTDAVDKPFILSPAPQMTDGPDGLQLEQQRIQAEHLSRVLHDNFTLANVADLPESQFASRRHTRYGSLGTHTETMRDLRSITAPAPPIQSLKSTLEDLLDILDVTGVPHLRASVSDDRLRSQPMLLLRGGSGHDNDKRRNTKHVYNYEERIALHNRARLFRYDRAGMLQALQRIHALTWNVPSYHLHKCQLTTH